jgi:hypothetical protein
LEPLLRGTECKSWIISADQHEKFQRTITEDYRNGFDVELVQDSTGFSRQIERHTWCSLLLGRELNLKGSRQSWMDTRPQSAQKPSCCVM